MYFHWQPKKSFGYLFYRTSENEVFVAQRGVFPKRKLIFKEDSGSAIDTEEIPESSNVGTLNDTNYQLEDETTIDPIENSIPLRWSSRVSMPP